MRHHWTPWLPFQPDWQRGIVNAAVQRGITEADIRSFSWDYEADWWRIRLWNHRIIEIAGIKLSTA